LTNPNCTTDSSATFTGSLLKTDGTVTAVFKKQPLMHGNSYHSRIDYWRAKFAQQLASNTVPALTYITIPNDHTSGVRPGIPTPSAMVADNDLAVGQFIETLSKSKIWSQSAVFVLEDDSQDGADHVDAHRMPALVISPWAKKGAVVHTRYDQDSALRSAMMLLGLTPLTLNDALATPMYDAFGLTTDTPDTAKYTAIQPQQSLTAVTSSSMARKAGALAAARPYGQLDQVPQALFDQVIWKSVHGANSTPPVPGPNASPVEAQRAAGALKALRSGGNVAKYLDSVTPDRLSSKKDSDG
jgi:phospholipase C